MSKFSKAIKMILFTTILIFGLVACGGDDEESKDAESSNSSGEISGDVTMWTASLSGEPFDSYFEDIKSDFEELHPDVNVKIEDIPQDEIEQKVLTSLTGDEVPDVINLAPRYMVNIAAQGGLMDLEDLVDDETKNTYLEGPFEAGYFDDGLYALPWYLTTTVSFYNDEHFEEAGVTETPSSIDEIYDTAKKITDKTGKPSYFQIINEGDVMMNKMASLANGEPLVEDGKTVLADNEEIKKFFETTQKMYEEGMIPQENAEGTFNTAQELFMGGNLSFLETGVTFLGPIEDGAPKIYENTKADQPLSEPDAPLNVAVMNFSIPAKSSNPDAAVALAEFVTNAENQLEFSKIAETVLPSTEESLEDDYFKEPGDSPKDLARAASAEALDNAEVLFPPLENGSELREAVKNAYVKNLQGKLTPEEALQEITEKWDASFEKTGNAPTF